MMSASGAATPAAPGSAALYGRAQRVTPGGVNSPVRAFGAVGGTPRFMAQGQGAYLPDADRKSTRLNSSHANISYAVFCLKNNTTQTGPPRSAHPTSYLPSLPYL